MHIIDVDTFTKALDIFFAPQRGDASPGGRNSLEYAAYDYLGISDIKGVGVKLEFANDNLEIYYNNLPTGSGGLYVKHASTGQIRGYECDYCEAAEALMLKAYIDNPAKFMLELVHSDIDLVIEATNIINNKKYFVSSSNSAISNTLFFAFYYELGYLDEAKKIKHKNISIVDFLS